MNETFIVDSPAWRVPINKRLRQWSKIVSRGRELDEHNDDEVGAEPVASFIQRFSLGTWDSRSLYLKLVLCLIRLLAGHFDFS